MDRTPWTQNPFLKMQDELSYQQLSFFYVKIFSSSQKTCFARRGKNMFFMVVSLILISFSSFEIFHFFFTWYISFSSNPTNITFGRVLSSTYYPHYASHEIPEKRGQTVQFLWIAMHIHTFIDWLVGHIVWFKQTSIITYAIAFTRLFCLLWKWRQESIFLNSVVPFAMCSQKTEWFSKGWCY